VNDVQHSPEWSSLPDQKTGYLSKSLLVIPLQVKENVIGALEVVNKKDGSPFKQEDQDLLMAFASQSAVVIENVRLYMNTDQALTARVEELSIMQRIVRELNNTLDTGRAMSITLEWAMRQTSASAGLVGIIQEEGIKIMASQGYNDEIQQYQETTLPMDGLNLEDIENSGVPYNRSSTNISFASLLRSSQSQTVIPIRRDKPIGIMFLEFNNPEACSEDDLVFLARLSDHAAIAISNAQLYAAVQAANIAKSEFVSFVSHELKNPMTSIKGYTELLAAGAVGPVTEGQANFLTTIRSNVDRMATLVSDLADVSRIEAGRIKLDFIAVNFKDVAEEVIRSLRRMIEEKKQQLILDLSPDLPQIWADRVRLVQIVTNLLSNSCKYTPAEGEIIVSAEVCDNQWDQQKTRVVHVQVKDNGIGMNPEDQKKVFQQFFRSEDPQTREAPGTGLGLNITRSLVEFQGGHIWFESEFRKGTIFHFAIPVAEQDQGKN
jgi:signal transduction histidine kinase